jgi:hypothetical protein
MHRAALCLAERRSADFSAFRPAGANIRYGAQIGCNVYYLKCQCAQPFWIYVNLSAIEVVPYV